MRVASVLFEIKASADRFFWGLEVHLRWQQQQQQPQPQPQQQQQQQQQPKKGHASSQPVSQPPTGQSFKVIESRKVGST